MIRRIIRIDEDRCNGCGLCANACHENAIGMIDGKARLLRDDYCDGLGDCLPVCPTGAISFEEREAAAYDEAAVKANMARDAEQIKHAAHGHGGCPGAMARSVAQERDESAALRSWPVQIKLVPVRAPYFENASLLVAADCAAYAYGRFHEELLRGRVPVIGCPKLDNEDYSAKLRAILEQNEIKSVTVVRMEVPCCGGLEQAVKTALRDCGKQIPWQVVTVTIDGRLIRD